MSALLVGYARCSTDQPDLTGTNRERRGLGEALAACRAGDTLVVHSSPSPAFSRARPSSDRTRVPHRRAAKETTAYTRRPRVAELGESSRRFSPAMSMGTL